MRPSPTAAELSEPRGAAGETASQSGGEAADYLSALPDDLLHRILSSLKTWEVVRTCVLARRWRHLWASATCLDVRTRFLISEGGPEDFCGFVNRLFLFRDPSAPVDTLRLRLGGDDLEVVDDKDADTWIRAAIKRKARVIHAAGHRRCPAPFGHVPATSCHLKILKLSYASLDLGQLSSSCTSLEELDLKDCLLTGDEVVSASLKTLTMLNCKMNSELSVAAPSLVLLRLITPYVRVPSFKSLGSLVIGTVIIDDYLLSDDISEDDYYEDTTDDDDDTNCACKHITDQEDCDETTAADDDNGAEHIIDREDCDESTDDHDSSIYGSEHIFDQEDCDGITDGDDNNNHCFEHIIHQEDCDGTTRHDDNSNCGSEHSSDQEVCDENSDAHDTDNSNPGSEHIINQEDFDQTSHDDDSNCGSEHIIDQKDCDETIEDDDNDNCNCVSEHIINQEGCDQTSDDDDSNCGSEHIIDQDCDETIKDDGNDNCNCVFEHIIDQEDCDEITGDEGDDRDDTDKRDNYKIDGDFGCISEDDDFEENFDEEDDSDNSTNSTLGYLYGGQKENHGHDSDIDSDNNTYEYSEIAKEAKYGYHADRQKFSKAGSYHSYGNIGINDSEYLGGQNILRSLSNVTSLGLSTHAGEVVLSRELKRCPTFSNLKTLSLGEWCMAADFDAVIFLLQHSPNIERLFLELKLSFDTRCKKALETGVRLQGRSFTCRDLQVVKIKCSKDDPRVHKLANLFIANGIPLEKILVRRTGSAYLRAQKQTDQAMHELMMFGPDWTHTKVIKFLERSSLVA